MSTEYTKTTWQTGDIITADKMNNIENGVKGIEEDVTTVKDGLQDIEEEISHLDGLSEDVKQALLQIASKVAYIDEDGQDYYDDLYNALYEVTAIHLDAQSIMLTSIGSTQQLTATTTPIGGAVTWASSNTSIATVSNTGLVTSVGYGSCTVTASSGSVSASCAVAVSQVTLTSIAADYQQSGTVYDTASLDSLKSDLTVIATYSDSSTATVTEYTLSGTLTVGTSTVTVSYGGKTATFNVTVTAVPTLSSISAVYTQSGTVYNTDTLDSLKSDLVVTAHMSDSTTQTVTAYTLSGTLTIGTSVITVTYSGKTTTFNVTVSQPPYTWRYSASSGDLLSEESYFESVTIGETCTEELTGGVLKLTSLKNNQQDAMRYYLTPTTNNHAAIKFRIRYVEIPIATGGSGFRVVLSDGSKGSRIGVRKDQSADKYKLVARAGTTDTDIAEIELNTWYEVLLEKNGQNTVVTLDGTEVYNSNNPSTSYTTENQIFNQSTNVIDSVVDIDYIEYHNYDIEE